MAEHIPPSDVADAILNLIESEYITAGGEECLIELADLDGDGVNFIVNDGDDQQHRFALTVRALNVKQEQP